MLFIMFAMAMTLAMIISTAIALHGEVNGQARAASRHAPLRFAELRIRK